MTELQSLPGPANFDHAVVLCPHCHREHKDGITAWAIWDESDDPNGEPRGYFCASSPQRAAVDYANYQDADGLEDCYDLLVRGPESGCLLSMPVETLFYPKPYVSETFGLVGRPHQPFEDDCGGSCLIPCLCGAHDCGHRLECPGCQDCSGSSHRISLPRALDEAILGVTKTPIEPGQTGDPLTLAIFELALQYHVYCGTAEEGEGDG